jgi:hypothetical protein
MFVALLRVLAGRAPLWTAQTPPFVREMSPSSSLQSPLSAPRFRLTLFVGWLVPGCAYLLLDRRHWRRGVIFLVALHLTFFIGVCLHGGVLWPVWNPRDAAFSFVNNLIFLAQVGAGWPALLSLLAHFEGWRFAAAEPRVLYELGSFYCFVAGVLNLLIISQSLDLGRKKPFEILAKE